MNPRNRNYILRVCTYISVCNSENEANSQYMEDSVYATIAF